MMIQEGCSPLLKSLVKEGFTIFFHVHQRFQNRLGGDVGMRTCFMETPRRGVSTFAEAIIDRPHSNNMGNLSIRAGVNYTYGDANINVHRLL